jgi:hypothetical protein
MEVAGQASQERKIVLLEKGEKTRKFIINDDNIILLYFSFIL